MRLYVLSEVFDHEAYLTILTDYKDFLKAVDCIEDESPIKRSKFDALKPLDQIELEYSGSFIVVERMHDWLIKHIMTKMNGLFEIPEEKK